MFRFLLSILLASTTFLPVAAQEAVTYDEPYRPQFHFTPPRNWMNDPNGMVYYDGEYHLFYQYNPEGDRWGHMSWGHAVSPDLVHWEHLPLALAEEDGVMIFSGSAVVDWKNTSGFGVDGKPPLVAIYTGHQAGRQDQRIAYSVDRGRTWTKYDGNPVLDLKMADFRDPKVSWHEPTSRWIMTVALPAEQKVHFYASNDLKSWKFTGEFGPAGMTQGLWECPDLFELPLESPPGSTREGGGSKWVLIVNINPGSPAGGSGCQYFIGEFDGSRFVADPIPPLREEFVPEGKVLTDFEGGYGDWKRTGDAFGEAPASGALSGQQAVTGFRGKGLVNSFAGGDRSTGTLTSPAFEIGSRYVSFLIGGGAHAETRMDLIVDGRVVRTASGDSRERLTWKSWNVDALQGRQAQIQIVDQHVGGWGHINVDHVLLSDEPAQAADHAGRWADYGADFYAAVSWNDVPKADGRRIWLAWMSDWSYAGAIPTSPWRSAMTIPRELFLFQAKDGLRMGQRPVEELKKLRGEERRLEKGTFPEASAWIAKQGIESGPLELEATFPAGEGSQGFRLFERGDVATTVLIDRHAGQVIVDRTRSGNTGFHEAFAKRHVAPLDDAEGPVHLHLFVDASSVEVFVNGGERSITSQLFPPEGSDGVSLFGEENAVVEDLRVWPLQSIWK
ncbi:MAG TPA: glycoside hydrolase family 32 protein [Pirellulaceae bacterium]|jgi:beta-fructofuranosidase/levanase|nr:glycoside hydrolase family 32 protein [Pirellulaceae bacterium]